MIVTFDLFSALTDTRTGASRTFAGIAGDRGWDVSGERLYDRWDRHNKALQRTARPPVTFHELSRAALVTAYADLGLAEVGGDPDADLALVEASVPDWPLWPDVAAGVQAVARVARVGLLSNVDDDLVRRTQAYRLVEPDLVWTSQRLAAYKPDPEIYRRAVAAAAPDRLVHVAASGRDVRGALEAGITAIRLARPGHAVDEAGPRPTLEVADAAELAGIVARLSSE